MNQMNCRIFLVLKKKIIFLIEFTTYCFSSNFRKMQNLVKNTKIFFNESEENIEDYDQKIRR